MHRAVATILREFEKRSAIELEEMRRMEKSGTQRHLDDFLLSVGPATGQLINLLAKEASAQVILEVGSSYGYSTVWLAEAARETGGKVISLESHSDKQQHARASIQTAGLDERVDFVLLADAYRRHVRTKPGIQSVLLPVGCGIELSRYK